MGELFDFLFAELGEGSQPVEVLRVGEFVDANGRAVTITDDDLDAFVVSFEAGTAGQDVPVDVDHERAEAAGWLTALRREGERLLAVVDWNEVGIRLVGGKIYRYASAAIDLGRRVIRSVSLVNFPAVKGMRPVELSEGVYGLEVVPGLMERVIVAIKGVFGSGVELADGVPGTVAIGDYLQEGGDAEGQGDKGTRGQGDFGIGDDSGDEEGEMNEQELAELREQIREEERAAIEAQMAEVAATRVELREQVRVEVEVELAARFERHAGLVEFAAEVCGDETVGLAAKADEVVEFLDGLTDDQVEAAKALLQGKVVDFREIGSTGDGDQSVALGEEYREALRMWVDSKQPLAEFFEVNADELGEMGQYDLAEFESAD